MGLRVAEESLHDLRRPVQQGDGLCDLGVFLNAVNLFGAPYGKLGVLLLDTFT